MKKQFAIEKTFRVPGGLTIPLIGIASIIWLLTRLSNWEILSTIIFISAICLSYIIMNLIKRKNNTVDLQK